MLSQPYGHSAAGRIMSMKNSNDTIGNQTHDLSAFSAVKIRGAKLYIKTNYVRFKKNSLKFQGTDKQGKTRLSRYI
jgi:hypothetical protein